MFSGYYQILRGCRLGCDGKRVQGTREAGPRRVHMKKTEYHTVHTQ